MKEDLLKNGLEAKHFQGTDVPQWKRDLVWELSDCAAGDACSVKEATEITKTYYARLVSLVLD